MTRKELRNPNQAKVAAVVDRTPVAFAAAGLTVAAVAFHPFAGALALGAAFALFYVHARMKGGA